MSTPQFSENNDAKILRIFERYKEVNKDNDLYMDALRNLVNMIMIGQDFQTKELKIIVYLNGEGTHHVSLQFMENRTLSEL